MGKLTCGCLNVKIHTKKTELDVLDVAQLGLDENTNEEFFTLKVSEVQLDLEGIRVEHPCLLRKRMHSSWVTHKCMNCEMYTHAIHESQGNSKVLVNMSLKSDPTILERLGKSPDFSPLFKIILKSRNDNHPVRTLGLQSGKYDTLQQTLTSIQKQLNKFLSEEEALMEERIRAFEEEQRQMFAELQSKARRDKNAIVSLVLAEEEGDLKEREEQGNLGSQKPVNNRLDAKTTSQSAAKSPLEFTTASKDLNLKTQITTAAPKSTPTPSAQAQRVPQPDDSPDVEGLFDLEGINENDSRPFYMSDDDETGDTDDSSATEDYGYMRGGAPVKSIYSSSVPITVPNWRMPRHRQAVPEEQFDEDDDERVPVLDPERMAASIQAMARSVHCDGTEMFGDRPRPRLNTADLGQI